MNCQVGRKILGCWGVVVTPLTIEKKILSAGHCGDSVVVRNHKVTGSNPPPVRFESNVSALSELSINCTMA